MSLAEKLETLAERFPGQLPHVKTEEATKNAFVMPVINALGFNVFDPSEVVPEFVADVGVKKGEKVDYAIYVGGKPLILIECKTAGSKLSLKHASQLLRYYGVTEAKIAVLTNGIEWEFFTDIDTPNRMDERPFLTFSFGRLDDEVIEQLGHFTKEGFDLDLILSNASELKYAKRIKALIESEYGSPSEDFVKHFASQVFDGRMTSSAKEQFTELVKQAFRDFVRDRLRARLSTALEADFADPVAGDATGDTEEPSDGIETTADEIQGFHIVRAILSDTVELGRVVIRDAKSYCSVLLDDNNRKPICRLWFNRSQYYLGTFDSEKNETKHAISSLTEIHQHRATLIDAVLGYDGKKPTADDEPPRADGNAASEGDD